MIVLKVFSKPRQVGIALDIDSNEKTFTAFLVAFLTYKISRFEIFFELEISKLKIKLILPRVTLRRRPTRPMKGNATVKVTF